MGTKQTVRADAGVLRWARKTRGYTRHRAADELGISEGELASIETGRLHPSPKLFQKMSSVYQQVESVLLLPDPPETDPLPDDYRTVGGLGATLTPDTLLAIRQARRVQHIVTEVVDADRELMPHANIPNARTSDDTGRWAQKERQRFGISVKMQRSWRPGDETFNGWRARTQGLGVLVILKKMPWEDCRGLSLSTHGLVPTIVVNSEDHPNARIFTLFHEYAHLMLRQSGSCVQAQNNTAKGKVEKWCNSFAAQFLVPTTALRYSLKRTFASLDSSDWTLSEIRKLATEFRVSRYVIARRLDELEVTDFCQRHAKALHAFDKKPEPPAAGGSRIAGWPAVQKLSEIGFMAASAILNAWREQIIDTIDVTDALELRADQLDLFEQRALVLQSRYPSA